MRTEAQEIRIFGAGGGWMKLMRGLEDGPHFLRVKGDNQFDATVTMQVWDHDLLDLADELVRFAGGPRA